MSGGAADDASGRMANSVSVTAGSASNTATDYGVYTYSGDLGPIIGVGSGCDGCHSVSWTRANIVGVAGTGTCAGFTRVVATSSGLSMLYNKAANAAPCGGVMPPSTSGLSAANLKILRAWINNGALNN